MESGTGEGVGDGDIERAAAGVLGLKYRAKLAVLPTYIGRSFHRYLIVILVRATNHLLYL